MRILYIDIDSLRPDHLGCYGYQRATSPNIDAVAADGVRFERCHVADAPCLPSRSGLFSGRFGIHNGVVGHGGTAADPFVEGYGRAFHSRLGQTSWMRCLRNAGLRTATISSFAERHSAWHWYANFSEIINPGLMGLDGAEEVEPLALDWLQRNARDDNWFLHVNLWDPHTPYRAPAALGEPFADEPLPAWLTEEVRAEHWGRPGPHSAREVQGFIDGDHFQGRYPRQPVAIDSMEQVRRMFDGYDTGVLHADATVGRLLNALADAGVLDETVVVVTADHGEDLGELNSYGDHQFADQITTRIPLLVRWPGVSGARVDAGLHYQVDVAATMIELLGGQVPDIWDGRGFAQAFKQGRDAGRDYLVLSQCAWTCQRSVRFEDYICIRSYHEGFHGLPDVMLFDVVNDPHEQHDLAPAQPETVARAMAMLDHWQGEMLRGATHAQDPLRTVMAQGGPWHTRGQLPTYLKRLEATGRGEWAKWLAEKHPGECG